MGLDVTAFARVELTPEHTSGQDCEDEDHVLAFTLDFPRSIRGLIKDRCYRVEEPVHGFRAGSYASYHHFRILLCQAALGIPFDTLLMDPLAYVDEPFYELLNFADNEGTIGPEAARDLAGDFAAGRDTVLPAMLAAAPPADRAWLARLWEDWSKAFELAGPGGLVLFG